MLAHAYHGVTDAVADLSPQYIEEPAPYVATLPPPDDYRGEWRRDTCDRGERYAAAVEGSIERLRAKGHAPAAFFVDTILSSNGIFVPAPGYLAGVFEQVRASGGLCIADEVQAGFGRTGERLWGFELGGVVPDIVTFGKPIGNGHPIGAVITRREIADAFAATTDYFSTTGGNPVSCAAGLAVLEVIEREGLQRNALETGVVLAQAIDELTGSPPPHRRCARRGPVPRCRARSRPRDPRARGNRNPRSGERMRERGVLIGRSGPLGNVLKIRPPIVFGPTHVEQLVAALDDVLQAIGG